MTLFPGKTYTRFIVLEFIKVFLVCMIFLLGLSFIVRTVEDADKFKTFTFIQMVIIRILEAPEIISREALLPSSMFAAVYTMSNLTKKRETLALRSCGVSAYKIISPLILVGFLIACGSLLFEDYIVLKSYLVRLKNDARLKGKEFTLKRRDRHNLVVFGENDIIYKMERFSSESQEMKNVLVIRKIGEGSINYRIDAEKGTWDGERWVFHNGIMRVLGRDGNIEEEKIFQVFYTEIRDDPQHFGKESRSVRNMTLREGYNYCQVMRKMGLDYRGVLTEYHREIANSFTIFLVVVIGLSLGSMPFKNALVISFSVTLITLLIFLFLIEIGYTFGSSGKISPVIGGWLGNIVFSIVGVLLLRKVRI
jgi:lipopolysaccharide export system permease protein